MDVQVYGNGVWHPHETRTPVYDGWLPVLEITDHANGTSNTTEYFWGVDLSGTEQGAGGVGGLLAISVDGQYHLPCYDHNGNITAYISESGTPSAQYLYDAFGNTLEQSGAMADAFRFRFSTKYFIPETRAYYYGYRFYSPEQGRWFNRDPIGEEGGLNLYGFARNNPVNKWDYLGLELDLSNLPDKCGNCEIQWTETPGVNGAITLTPQWKLDADWYILEECPKEKSTGGRQYYKLKMKPVTCLAQIQIDTDPKSKTGKGDLTIADHELKHVRAWSDALDWMYEEISRTVYAHCCCDITKGVELMQLIREAAGIKGQADSFKVDADDYVRHDNRAEGEVKGVSAAQLGLRLERKMNEIDKKAKEWRECK